VIVDMRIATDHVKRDVERTVRALISDDAVRVLRRTFEDAGVLPSTTGMPGSGANLLADSVAAEPAESFESIRFRGAYELALDTLDQQQLRRGRHASFLLGLCALGVFAAIILVVWGSLWRDTAAATHASALACLMCSGVIGLWYRHASRIAERGRADLRTLAKVELRRP
jgi:hypothetical protein